MQSSAWTPTAPEAPPPAVPSSAVPRPVATIIDPEGPPVVDVPRLNGSLAIFDLDRTLHSGSGLGVLARLAFRSRLISADRLARSLAHDLVFRRRGSTDAQIGSIAELALEMAGGASLDELDPLVATAADQIAASVRPGMRVLVESHVDAEHYCVLLSASPHGLVEQVAERLGMQRGIGTVIEDTDRVLTGRIVPPMCYGPGKLERLEQVLGWKGDTEHETFSYAYADSLSDLPLLDSVTSPVVVSPDRRLRRLATERDWPVIDC